jgi:hypothetical protein
VTLRYTTKLRESEQPRAPQTREGLGVGATRCTPQKSGRPGQDNAIDGVVELGHQFPCRRAGHRRHAYLDGAASTLVHNRPPTGTLVFAYEGDAVDGDLLQTGQPGADIKRPGSRAGQCGSRRFFHACQTYSRAVPSMVESVKD